MYDTNTYDMYNYDMKYNIDILHNNKVQEFPLAFR